MVTLIKTNLRRATLQWHHHYEQLDYEQRWGRRVGEFYHSWGCLCLLFQILENVSTSWYIVIDKHDFKYPGDLCDGDWCQCGLPNGFLQVDNNKNLTISFSYSPLFIKSNDKNTFQSSPFHIFQVSLWHQPLQVQTLCLHLPWLQSNAEDTDQKSSNWSSVIIIIM